MLIFHVKKFILEIKFQQSSNLENKYTSFLI